MKYNFNLEWFYPEELELLLSYLNKDAVMFEYGSGTTSLVIADHVKELHTVEHNRDFYKQIKKLYLRHNKKNLHSYYGHSVNNEAKGSTAKDVANDYINFKGYYDYPDKLNIKCYSHVLIDGRARVKCAEHIVNYMSKDSILFFHDFTNRKSYHERTLKLFDVIETKKTLMIGKLK